MRAVSKIQHKGQVTIPTRVRNQAGLSEGDVVEFSFLRGKIVITPKVAGDEYTAEQRARIDAGIRQGLEDFKRGRAHGPFASAKEAAAYIERVAKERAASAKPVKPAR